MEPNRTWQPHSHCAARCRTSVRPSRRRHSSRLFNCQPVHQRRSWVWYREFSPRTQGLHYSIMAQWRQPPFLHSSCSHLRASSKRKADDLANMTQLQLPTIARTAQVLATDNSLHVPTAILLTTKRHGRLPCALLLQSERENSYSVTGPCSTFRVELEDDAHQDIIDTTILPWRHNEVDTAFRRTIASLPGGRPSSLPTDPRKCSATSGPDVLLQDPGIQPLTRSRQRRYSTRNSPHRRQLLQPRPRLEPRLEPR
jgi:hypothetical protein